MKKYAKIFAGQISVDVAYPAELVAQLIWQVLPILGMLILWSAIYRDQALVGGLSQNQAIAYYIITALVGLVTEVQLSETLGTQVRTGFISNQLLRPYHFTLGEVVTLLASKFGRLVLVLPFYLLGAAILAIAFGVDFSSVTPLGLLVGIVFIILGLAVHVALDLAIVWSAFWFDDVWWFRHVKWISFNIFGGKLFPISLLPLGVLAVFEFLPLKFIYYIPISYILGISQFDRLGGDLLVAGFWLVLLLTISALVWRRGIAKYGAFGG